MSEKIPLEGLVKWAQRDPWQEMFEEVLGQHLGPACEEADVEIEHLADLLDALDFAKLWLAAFEDLVGTEFDGRNVADDYLKRRGWKESAGTRAYIRAFRQSVQSLYEVSGVQLNKGFFLRDLVRGGEPFWVNEKLATHHVAQWDCLAARVVTVNGRTELAGAVLPFDRVAGDELLAELKAVVEASPEDLAEMLERSAEEVGEEIDAELTEILDSLRKTDIAPTVDESLARSAFIISTHWLRGKLDKELNPPEVQLFNSDGEPYEPTAVIYPLADRVSPRKVRSALAGLSVLRQETDDFWNWLEPKRSPEKLAQLPKTGRVLFSEIEDGSNVLGTIELEGDSLVLSVSSFARAGRGRELLEPVLGNLVGKPDIEQQSVEDLIAGDDQVDDDAVTDDSIATIPLERRREIMQEYYDRHYRDALDRPIPVLGDLSPRKAAADTKERDKAVSWVKSIENNHARQALADPTLGYDCSWIWDELGLGSYRNS